QLQLQGPDPAVLLQLAERIQTVVKQTHGAVDVGLSTRGQKPELNVGVNRGQLANSLRFAFAGVDAGTWVDPDGISRYVHVRLVPEARENASDLGQLPVVVTPNLASGTTATTAGVSQTPP